MIKRFIFDLDGTLIDKVDFSELVKRKLKEFNYQYTDTQFRQYMQAMQNYEKKFSKYTFDDYFEYIHQISMIDFSPEYMKSFLSSATKCVPDFVHQDVISALNYLKEKYELVVLTNFFKDVQLLRMENVGLPFMFDDVIGGDKFIKPMKDAFFNAAGERCVDECIMIGDSKAIDYDGAVNCGMQAILFDRESPYQTKNLINNFNELRKRF